MSMRFLIGSLFGSKRELLTELLEKGQVMVHLDATSEGVSVPESHQSNAHLRLNLSLHFGVDVAMDDDAVAASLLFQGARHDCVLPWSAIFALTSQAEPTGYLWPEDLPSELVEQMEIARPDTTAGALPPEPRLRVIPGDKTSDEDDALRPPLADPPGPVRRGGHLRLVK